MIGSYCIVHLYGRMCFYNNLNPGPYEIIEEKAMKSLPEYWD